MWSTNKVVVVVKKLGINILFSILAMKMFAKATTTGFQVVAAEKRVFC